jgi:hypothetical protein
MKSHVQKHAQPSAHFTKSSPFVGHQFKKEVCIPKEGLSKLQNESPQVALKYHHQKRVYSSFKMDHHKLHWATSIKRGFVQASKRITTSYIEQLASKEGLFKLQNESPQVTLSYHHQKITWIGQAQASPHSHPHQKPFTPIENL